MEAFGLMLWLGVYRGICGCVSGAVKYKYKNIVLWQKIVKKSIQKVCRILNKYGETIK